MGFALTVRRNSIQGTGGKRIGRSLLFQERLGTMTAFTTAGFINTLIVVAILFAMGSDHAAPAGAVAQSAAG